MEDKNWVIEVHDEFDFKSFLARQSDQAAAEIEQFFLQIIKFENLLDLSPGLIKPLGLGLFEFRIRTKRQLTRLFFTYRFGRVILLLGGYDKLRNSSKKKQNSEITLARKRLGKS